MQKKPRGFKKDCLAAWGLYTALHDAVEYTNSLLAHGEEAASQLEALCHENKALELSVRSQQLREKELDTALLRATRAEEQALEIKLQETQHGLKVMTEAYHRAQTKEVNHVECRKEIEELKRQIGLQQGMVSAVHPDALVDLQNLSKSSAPLDAIPSSPFNPNWEKTKEPEIPINPIVNKVVCNQGSGKNIRQDITEQVAWKPQEAKAIADTLVSFNQSTGVEWLISAWTSYPTDDG